MSITPYYLIYVSSFKEFNNHQECQYSEKCTLQATLGYYHALIYLHDLLLYRGLYSLYSILETYRRGCNPKLSDIHHASVLE